MLQSMDVRKFLAAAAAPTVTPTGGVGTTQTYKLVAKLSTGGPGGLTGSYAAVSAGGSTAAGPATLDSTHYNTITGVAVPGADSYDVYRTVGGATQGKIGNILAANIAGSGLVDNGLVADGTTAPATGTSGLGAWVDVSGVFEKSAETYGTFVATIQYQGANDKSRPYDIGSAATAAGLTALSQGVQYVRAKMTAYTSGTPLAKLHAAGL